MLVAQSASFPSLNRRQCQRFWPVHAERMSSLINAGLLGTGMPDKVLANLRRRLHPLARKRLRAGVSPRETRVGSPLVLSRVHRVEPKLVCEITFLTWTAGYLLRHRFALGCARASRLSHPHSGVCVSPFVGLEAE